LGCLSFLSKKTHYSHCRSNIMCNILNIVYYVKHRIVDNNVVNVLGKIFLGIFFVMYALLFFEIGIN
jgi:hypothetical protein